MVWKGSQAMSFGRVHVQLGLGNVATYGMVYEVATAATALRTLDIHNVPASLFF